MKSLKGSVLLFALALCAGIAARAGYFGVEGYIRADDSARADVVIGVQSQTVATAIQPGDDVSSLENDAGYLADVPTLADAAAAGPFAGTEAIEVMTLTASNVVLRVVGVDTNTVVISEAGTEAANGTYMWDAELGSYIKDGAEIAFVDPFWILGVGGLNVYESGSVFPIDWVVDHGDEPAPTGAYGAGTNTVTFVIDPVTGALKLDADLDVDGDISADNLGTMSAEAAADYYTASQTDTAIVDAAPGLFAGAGTTGLVTSTAEDSGKFLQWDGNFEAVPQGDMLVSDYDPAGGQRQVAFLDSSVQTNHTGDIEIIGTVDATAFAIDGVAVPGPGCTTLTPADDTVTVTGATWANYAALTGAATNTLAISATAMIGHYSLIVDAVNTNALALSADMAWFGDAPEPAVRYAVGFQPFTNSTWIVYGAADEE